MSPKEKQALTLPHHKLIAYQVAVELLRLGARIRISDAELRQQARKAAKSAVLNTAEGAARQTLADSSEFRSGRRGGRTRPDCERRT